MTAGGTAPQILAVDIPHSAIATHGEAEQKSVKQQPNTQHFGRVHLVDHGHMVTLNGHGPSNSLFKNH